MPLGLSDNLFQRIVSALLLLPPVLWAIYAGGYWFSGLLAVGGALMMLEWCQLTSVRHKAGQGTAVLMILALVWVLEANALPSAALLLTALLVTAVVGTLLAHASLVTGWWLAGVAYVGFPIAALWLVRDFNALLVLWIFLVVWATDVGGYFAGKGIGGPKLAPRISPKKTWAGLLGGMALSVAISVAMQAVVPFASSALVLAGFAALLAIWAQVGDLLESGIKRHFGVKDSGGLIPGHGGLLDRVDGLVFVAPAVVIISWVGPVFGFEFY
ncbi:phosphatidate cytidylyltransferase [Kordiimonas aestuarii]|uniref:phosphatidate cytidylyltransferase n=1 Tax=Kordiimonas aestuarii TaxID=1005925 RepID=UPI0021D14EDA|nr:phosphatidate cytidylyltransferase [Kordiimonas aestuarii]